MKREVRILYNTDTDPPQLMIQEGDYESSKPDPEFVIHALMEAAVVVIRSAHKSGLINEIEEVRKCVKHIGDAFVDDTMKLSMQNINLEQMQEG